jgi:branched-chain amino acid transport system ATP-binding protein
MLGLQAFRNKFVAELSTGSRRIVEIASILGHRPSVLILDEPSSGIAQKETEALGPLLKQAQAYLNCSMLIIEHDMPLITKLADHLVALDRGTVVTHGTPAEVLHHPVVVESYLGTTDESALGL